MISSLHKATINARNSKSYSKCSLSKKCCDTRRQIRAGGYVQADTCRGIHTGGYLGGYVQVDNCRWIPGRIRAGGYVKADRCRWIREGGYVQAEYKSTFSAQQAKLQEVLIIQRSACNTNLVYYNIQT